jgi:hypothetical protein
MQAGPSPAREARVRHRHGVRTLTYVTLDQGNGGILLNLTRNGVAVQSVAALRLGQQVQVRFDLLAPRVRVSARGEVVWATSSGRCGIRFLDLPRQTAHQLDEWTLAKLLEGAAPLPRPAGSKSRISRTAASPAAALDSLVPQIEAVERVDADDENLGEQSETNEPAEETDSSQGSLIISPGNVKVIDVAKPNSLGSVNEVVASAAVVPEPASESVGRVDWLSQPLSGRGLAWTVDALVVLAAWLLSVLVFLFVLREIPKWPVSMVCGAAVVVAGLYWGFFRIFTGASLGTKLAQLAETNPTQAVPEEDRFR